MLPSGSGRDVFVLTLSSNFKTLRDVIWDHIVLLPQVVSDCRSLVFFNSLVKVMARVTDIICIAQVTLKMIHKKQEVTMLCLPK